MNASLEASVRSYLEEFDRLSAQLPKHRRDTLRKEIEEHLRIAIPADATDAVIGSVLADFGSPAEIVEQEIDAAPASPRVPTRVRRLLIWGGVVLAVVGAGLAWLFISPMAFVLFP